MSRPLGGAERRLVRRGRRPHQHREAHLQQQVLLRPVDLGVKLEPGRPGIQPHGLAQAALAADPPLERHLRAQRGADRDGAALGGRARAAGLEVERVDVPGVEGGRAVVVDLEDVAGPLERLPVHPRARSAIAGCRRRPSPPAGGSSRAPRRRRPARSGPRPATRQRRRTRTPAPPPTPGPRPGRPPPRPGRRRACSRGSPRPAAVSASSAASRSAVPRRHDLQVARRLARSPARSTSRAGCRGTGSGAASATAARAAPRGSARAGPAGHRCRSSASCSSCSPRRLPRLTAACVVYVPRWYSKYSSPTITGRSWASRSSRSKNSSDVAIEVRGTPSRSATRRSVSSIAGVGPPPPSPQPNTSRLRSRAVVVEVVARLAAQLLHLGPAL